MNRPKMDSYDLSTKYTMCAFIRDLEKYCDELEKALDKACVELVKLNECASCYEYQEMGCPFADKCKIGTDYCHNKEQWKEWALKDGKKIRSN